MVLEAVRSDIVNLLPFTNKLMAEQLHNVDNRLCRELLKLQLEADQK